MKKTRNFREPMRIRQAKKLLFSFFSILFLGWVSIVLVFGQQTQTKIESTSSSKQLGTKQPLNFIIVLVDDLGWADVGCNGSTFYETPSIDRLAREGINFVNGYAACAVCSPTRASVQTGFYPARIGITDWIRGKLECDANPTKYESNPNWTVDCPPVALFLESSYITIANEMKKAGYSTAHIGKWHLGDRAHFPDKFGYDLNVGGCQYGQPPSYFDPYSHGAKENPSKNPPNVTLDESGYPDDLLPVGTSGDYLTDRESEEAIKFIRANKEKPFFLHLAHYAVHTPLMGKETKIEKYRKKKGTGNDSLQNNAVYAAMIESVDESLGEIMRVVEEEGIGDNTVILFTSDNGGLMGSTNNFPLRNGKGTPYEGGIRVPFIIWAPNHIRSGAVSETPVMTIDIFPTFLDWLGISSTNSREMDGKSLLPLLMDSQLDEQKTKVDLSREYQEKLVALSSRPLFWHFPHYRMGYAPYSIIRKDGFKLIKYYATDENSPSLYELFDLTNDPSETTNLAAKQSHKVTELESELMKALVEMKAQLPRAKK
ncbi:MAG: sulfatase [Thermoguttaceae bacterium]